jgi:hypothetical protein
MQAANRTERRAWPVGSGSSMRHLSVLSIDLPPVKLSPPHGWVLSVSFFFRSCENKWQASATPPPPPGPDPPPCDTPQ